MTHAFLADTDPPLGLAFSQRQVRMVNDTTLTLGATDVVSGYVNVEGGATAPVDFALGSETSLWSCCKITNEPTPRQESDRNFVVSKATAEPTAHGETFLAWLWHVEIPVRHTMYFDAIDILPGMHGVIDALANTQLGVELTPRLASGEGTRLVSRVHEIVLRNPSPALTSRIVTCTFNGWGTMWSENGQ